MLRDRIGNWLSWQRQKATGWKYALFIALGGLLVANIFLHPHHPHFQLETYWGFWALFGFGVSVLMTVVLKKIVFPIISRSEDLYDPDK